MKPGLALVTLGVGLIFITLCVTVFMRYTNRGYIQTTGRIIQIQESYIPRGSEVVIYFSFLDSNKEERVGRSPTFIPAIFTDVFFKVDQVISIAYPLNNPSQAIADSFIFRYGVSIAVIGLALLLMMIGKIVLLNNK